MRPRRFDHQGSKARNSRMCRCRLWPKGRETARRSGRDMLRTDAIVLWVVLEFAKAECFHQWRYIDAEGAAQTLQAVLAANRIAHAKDPLWFDSMSSRVSFACVRKSRAAVMGCGLRNSWWEQPNRQRRRQAQLEILCVANWLCSTRRQICGAPPGSVGA